MNRECLVNGCYLIVNAHSSMNKVNLNDILYFIVQGEYVHIQLASQRDLLTIDSLIKLEEVLPCYFFRINKSVIMNMYHCESYQLTYQYSFVKMSDGVQFSVSRRKYAALKGMYNTILSNSKPDTEKNQPFTDKFNKIDKDNNI